MQAGAEQNKKGPNKDNEIIAKSQDLRPSTTSEGLTTRDVGMATISIPGEPPVHKITRSTTSLLTNASTTFIPKGRSIAHQHDMARKGTVYISFDIETGREYCGILQISDEMVRAELSPVVTKKGPSPTLDYDSAIRRKKLTINRLVNPGKEQYGMRMSLQFTAFIRIIQASLELKIWILCGSSVFVGTRRTRRGMRFQSSWPIIGRPMIENGCGSSPRPPGLLMISRQPWPILWTL